MSVNIPLAIYSPCLERVITDYHSIPSRNQLAGLKTTVAGELISTTTNHRLSIERGKTYQHFDLNGSINLNKWYAAQEQPLIYGNKPTAIHYPFASGGQ